MLPIAWQATAVGVRGRHDPAARTSNVRRPSPACFAACSAWRQHRLHPSSAACYYVQRCHCVLSTAGWVGCLQKNVLNCLVFAVAHETCCLQPFFCVSTLTRKRSSAFNVTCHVNSRAAIAAACGQCTRRASRPCVCRRDASAGVASAAVHRGHPRPRPWHLDP